LPVQQPSRLERQPDAESVSSQERQPGAPQLAPPQSLRVLPRLSVLHPWAMPEV